MTVTAPISAEAVLKVAIGQEGVEESPPKSNHVLYAVWYGMDHAPWCAMFVSWTLHQAGFDQFAITTAKGYSAVYAGVDWFKKNDAWAGPEVVPEPGWVVFFGFGEGHTGLIKSARSITDITTIEGNTDSAGGGSGGKVMEKHRSATSRSDHILGYGVITYQDHQPSEEDDMYLPSFLAKSDDAKDSRVFLVEGNLASVVHLSSPDNVTWVKQLDSLMPDGKKLLTDQSIHTVKAAVLADITA